MLLRCLLCLPVYLVRLVFLVSVPATVWVDGVIKGLEGAKGRNRLDVPTTN